MVEWDIMYLVYIDGYFLNFSFTACILEPDSGIVEIRKCDSKAFVDAHVHFVRL